ncbi:hypothetical protein PN465_17825 [Nodularia spumigena CS-584]|jgi:hypothetical protein|uniref:Uncharacterized protein n=2 Tax=Nodularia spumigena TaxID=70799 RepID=A0A2S0Q9V2_NODSP|nr:hypothetical protein [Nodularia spumigena]AHJ29869.1 hypothetical protein NSP_35460 [Nodularia spumigena CCY9414]AVZ31229.1 hypothetical protein BMF81_03729 [Nodularia spumigena UHCC 0039]MDB9384058.1 hypothetical protein [Nodularia spumigena CS-584]MEA5527651.1 hypothetical protein [Nodularia spumigena UHCC 0143]MEA5559169.1 hypothetical protein [Nodularia spumigena CH309]
MSKTIEKKQLENIATWMKPIEQTNLPTALKGVFFMDGNPLPDDCITMYNAEWDTQQLTLVLPVFAPVQWTFHSSIGGWFLLRAVQFTQLTYKIQFEDESLRRSHIIPFVLGWRIPKWLFNATMNQDKNSHNGDIWQRENLWLSLIPQFGNYTLRRIVDEDGRYTPAFNNMITKVANECLVIGRNSK